MKAILHILLVAICGAGIYFSLEGKNKFQTLSTAVETTQADDKKLGDDIKDANTELSAEKTGLDSASADFDTKQAELETAKSNQKQIERQLAEFENILAEQEEQLNKQKSLLKETRETVADALGKNPDDITMETIASDIEQLKTTKKDLEKKIDDINTLVGAAEKAVSKNKTNIADLASRKAKRDERIRANAKEAVIDDVDNDWGFAIINAGSNVGFTPQTRLLVVRGNSLIGRIKPQSISPTQTVAEIDQASLAPGITLQTGDRVILEKPIRD